MTPRDRVLDRIRVSLKSAHLPAAALSVPMRPAAAPDGDSRQLVDRFAAEASAVGTNIYRPPNDADVIETVIRLLRDTGEADCLAWDDAELPLAGMGHAVRRAGFRPIDSTLPSEPTARAIRLAELGRAAAGVTGALAGLADTGTLAVLSGPGRPRLASLLPPVHIAVLRISALFATMAEFFAAHRDVTRNYSNLVFITGPSRSADIEHTLTIGVHGPKSLHIILAPDGTAS